MAVRRVRRFLGAGVLLATAVVGASPEVSAQPSQRASASSAAQPVEIARVRYRQGVDAYKAGRYRESIDYFLEADRLSPSAALSFNIARAYENIDDAAAALRWYRDYLRRDAKAADKTDVEKTIAAFEARLAEKGVQQITVVTEPPGATLLLDGQPLGVTPWTGEVAPGAHKLQLRRDGYAPAEQDLDVPPDHATDVALTLTTAAPEAAPTAAPSPAPAPAAPAAPAPRDESKESGSAFPFTKLGWVGVGVGGAALGGALVFELLRRGADSDAESDHTQVGRADHLDTMEGRQTAARILLGTGIVFAAAGGTLLYIGSRQEHTVGLACVPGACFSQVRGRF